MVLALAVTGSRGAALFSGHDRQVAALLAQMTLDEKIGQMVQADLNCVTNRADIQK